MLHVLGIPCTLEKKTSFSAYHVFAAIPSVSETPHVPRILCKEAPIILSHFQPVARK